MANRSASAIVKWTAVVIMCLLSTGCYKSKILVKVKNDGSGSIMITRIFSKGVVNMFEQQKKQMQNMGGEPGMEMSMTTQDPFFNEKSIKAEARQYGPSVKFVKAQKYDQDGARGYLALYSFDDINNVFFNLEPLMTGSSMGMAMMMEGDMDDDIAVYEAEKDENAIEFKFTRGTPNTLNIIVPDYPEPPEEEKKSDEEADEDLDSPAFGGADNEEMQMMMAGGNPFGFTGNETQQEAMLKVFKGMSMSLVVEIDGTDVKSNASHADKSSAGKYRYTLIELDMDKIMASKQGSSGFDPEMMMEGSGEPLETFGALQKYPGVKLETKKDLYITFK